MSSEVHPWTPPLHTHTPTHPPTPWTQTTQYPPTTWAPTTLAPLMHPTPGSLSALHPMPTHSWTPTPYPLIHGPYHPCTPYAPNFSSLLNGQNHLVLSNYHSIDKKNSNVDKALLDKDFNTMIHHSAKKFCYERHHQSVFKRLHYIQSGHDI